jgi:hypothetical protein
MQPSVEATFGDRLWYVSVLVQKRAARLELDGASPERVRAAYSPEDWQRLVGLKDRYDPGNLFRFNRNIPPSSVRE